MLRLPAHCERLAFKHSRLGIGKQPIKPLKCIAKQHPSWISKSAANGAINPPGPDGPVEQRVAAVRAWIDAWRAKQFAATAEPTTAPQGPEPSAAPPAATPAAGSSNTVLEFAHLGVTLAILYAFDQALKAVFLHYGIKFPSPLAGMFAVTAVLLAMGEKAAAATMKFFLPALDWIAKWLPTFYVPSLITLPLAIRGIEGDSLVKLLVIICGGMVATLLFTGWTAVLIRNIVRTEMKPVAKAKAASPFLPSHFIAWGAIAAVSLAFTAFAPTLWAPQVALTFQLAGTILGLLIGNLIPSSLHGVLHPVVGQAMLANGAAWLHGHMLGLDYYGSLAAYFTKGKGAWGGGDLLMSLLGIVIISFGFRIYSQRETMKRHAPEIMGATLLSSAFSMFTTAYAAMWLGLSSELCRSVIPRSVTVALALPISASLDANLSITAATVLLHGLVGANFGPALMTTMGIRDTIARGLAISATAGGLGTASLTAKEPEALPFCALSYSMVGILSTVIAAFPQVRGALIGIVG